MKNLVYLVTSKCNIECDFCAPNCGPKHKQHLQDSFMIWFYDEIRKTLPISCVIFTGGEPVLFLKDILSTLKHIKNSAPTPTRIVTNAFWAKNKHNAEKVIINLKEAGLYEFNFSVDDFHQKFIDLSTIKNAIEISLDHEIPVLLAHKSYPGSKSNLHTYEELLGRSIPVYEKLDPEKASEEPLMFSTGATIPIGRGAENINLTEWMAWNPNKQGTWKGPCKEILKSIVVNPDHTLSPCCGLVDRNIEEFYAGNFKSNKIIDVLKHANNSLLYNWLALEGPSAIMEYIKLKLPNKKFLSEYVQNCQLCQYLFSDPEIKTALKKYLPQKKLDLAIKRSIHEAKRNLRNNES